MDKKKIVGLMIAAACLCGQSAFADDYVHVSVFNRFTDWVVTVGKPPVDRDRIVAERVNLRARDREARDHHHMEARRDDHHDDHFNDHHNDHDDHR